MWGGGVKTSLRSAAAMYGFGPGSSTTFFLYTVPLTHGQIRAWQNVALGKLSTIWVEPLSGEAVSGIVGIIDGRVGRRVWVLAWVVGDMVSAMVGSTVGVVVVVGVSVPLPVKPGLYVSVTVGVTVGLSRGGVTVDASASHKRNVMSTTFMWS